MSQEEPPRGQRRDILRLEEREPKPSGFEVCCRAAAPRRACLDQAGAH